MRATTLLFAASCTAPAFGLSAPAQTFQLESVAQTECDDRSPTVSVDASGALWLLYFHSNGCGDCNSNRGELRMTRKSVGAWSQPQFVTESAAHWSQIAFGPVGTAYVSYTTVSGSSSEAERVKYFDGSSWGDLGGPLATGCYVQGGVGNAVMANSAGRVATAYFRGCDEDAYYAEWTGSDWITTVVENASRVGKGMRSALGADGYPMLAYLDQNSAVVHVALYSPSNGWAIEQPPGAVDPVELESLPDGGVFLMARANNQQPPLEVFQRDPATLMWSSDPSFPGAPYSFARAVVDPVNGDVHVVATDWQGRIDHLRRVGSTWSVSPVASGDAGGRGADIALAPNGRVHIAFTRIQDQQLMLASTSLPPATPPIVQPGDVIVVSEHVAGGLRVYDGCTGALKHVATDPAWNLSGSGRDVEVAPDGSIWVNDPVSKSVYRYDRHLTRTGAITSTFPCLPTPTPNDQIRGFTFDSAGALRILASLQSGSANALGSLDPSSGDVLGCTPIGFEPADVDELANGALAISAYTSPGLRIVHPLTGAVTRVVDCGGSVGTHQLHVEALSNEVVLVNEFMAPEITALDLSQPPGAECVWSISPSNTVYPHLMGIAANESTGEFWTMVNRAEGWSLERYRLDDQVLVSSTPMSSANGPSLSPPFSIAVFPGSSCTVTYCTSGITSNLCEATMSASGTPSISLNSGLVLTATSVEGQRAGLIFYGVGGRNSSPWGCTSTSVLCVKSPTQRMTPTASGGVSGSCSGSISQDWLAYLAAHPAALGQPFQSGTTVNAQCWFRDPPSCKSTNLSNALEFVTVP